LSSRPAAGIARLREDLHVNRTFKTVALPILVVFVLVYVAQSMFHFGGSGQPTKKAGWGTLVAAAKETPKSVEQVKFNQSNYKVSWVQNGAKFSAGYPRTGQAADTVVNELVAAGVPGERVEFSGVGGNEWLSLLLGALPFVLFLGLWIFLINQMQGGGSKVMSFGKSRAKRMAVDSPKITFKDVAGADEAVEELHEIKEFLENPKKFQALGARIPKGVLLYGPPGTGKTLLARAVAGEAGVPFFSISGSDFVEMFVGVGASRVRDLFEQAKQNAPCIIFMDEIDAVGRHRGAGMGGGHDEREQTLNQLLVEMDGFELKDNIILIAATNRPDILDPALLRPGRFDRQIVVDRPDRDGRKKILEVHTKGKPIGREIDLGALAGQTPGFTGADLANLVNEAALLAARRGRKTVGQDELEEGIMRVIAGPEKKTRLLSEKERLVTAYHEMGHALVAHYLEGCDPVHKISVISRGQALGYTISMPTEDTYLTTRTQLRDTLAMTLGGRAAEELVYDERTTGAANDLEKVTATAKAMIMRFGMSEKLGPRAFGRNHDQPFLGREYAQEPDYSDEVAREIDGEIQRIVEEADQRAKTVLAAHEEMLHRLAKVLLEQETIDRPQFLRLLDGATQDEVFPPPSATAPAEPVAEPKAKEKRSILPGLPSLPSEPDAQPGGA
jgi:cell division protease FtsH